MSTAVREVIFPLEWFIRSLDSKIYDRGQRVAIRCDIPQEWELPSYQVLSLGLILTELLTNSFKYAFEHAPNPFIQISVHRLATHRMQLVYSDNGPGLPSGQEAAPSTMGLSLVRDLTRQLNGILTFQQAPGLTYTFLLSLEEGEPGGGANIAINGATP